jgi:polygalacturonase
MNVTQAMGRRALGGFPIGRRFPICLTTLLICFGAHAADFDAKTYGAAGSGTILDTAAIQRAIDAAAAAGRTVYLPAGRFLSSTITLKSNVTLHLSPGAVLLGSTRMEDYKPKHLIYAQGVANVAMEKAAAQSTARAMRSSIRISPLPRPSPLIEIWDSRGICIRDITIRNVPAWAIHPKNCHDVKIRGSRCSTICVRSTVTASTSIPAAT